MTRLQFFIIIIFGSLQTVIGQMSLSAEECALGKIERMQVLRTKNARLAYPGDNNIDIKYYGLDLKITANPNYLSGHVQINFTAKNTLTEAQFDLKNNFLIDSILVNNNISTFTHQQEKITVSLPKPMATNEQAQVKIYYRGVPPTGPEAGFFFQTHSSARESVISTLSEPYGAPDWWPCKDNPADKADSADIKLTMSTFYTPVSNGKMVSKTVLGDGFHTYHWRTRYPIAHYLISIAASNYTEINQWYVNSKNDSMPIVHYLYPEVATNTTTRGVINNTAKMLSLFSDKFGEYPFFEEKYGHAMFNFGGGMEHQTISSMGGFSNGLVAHELAHQWYGDKVTCKTWQDIWVNEGFATYSECIWYENNNGLPAYNQVIQQYMDYAKNSRGSIFVQNPNDINEIFSFERTYAKGAIVLHMLRGVLGDDIFYKVLKEFAAGEYAFGVAGIDDFKKVAEAVSKLDLSYFFEEWLYGQGYPKYRFGWSPISANNSFGAAINIINQGSSSTKFTMPVKLLFTLEDGTTETRVVLVDQSESLQEINGFKQAVKSVTFDPNNEILKELVLVPGIVTANNSENYDMVYPNPAKEILRLDHAEEITELSLFDATGKMVKSIKKPERIINVNGLSQGVYLVKMTNLLGNTTVQRIVVEP